MDGKEALALAKSQQYALIVLDVMLPGMNGIDVCKTLRQSDESTPILMLTAKSAELDRVTGLESGADDYLTKPFSVMELQARVKALLRRAARPSAEPAPPTDITYGGMEILEAKRQVFVEGDEVHLTAKEFDLLKFMAASPGKVFTDPSAPLYVQTVWGVGYKLGE